MVDHDRELLVFEVLGFASTTCRAEGEIPQELKNVCLYHPEPAAWKLGRAGMHGKVVCQLKINPNNGEVDEVKILHHSPYQALDGECVLTYFKWRFKPHTITSATIPYELILRGYYKEIH